MKLLIISGSYPPIKDGMSEYTEKYYHECKKNITDTMLITSNEFSNKDSSIFNQIEKWNFNAIRYILRIINKYKPDIIQLEYPTKGYKNSILVNLLPIILKVKKCKVLLRYHEFSNSRLLRRFVDIPLVLFSDVIVTPSKHDCDLLKKLYFFKRNKISYIPIGINIDSTQFTNSKNKSNNPIKIGYFGYVYKGKGLEEIINVLYELDKENIKYEMNFICEFNKENDYQKFMLDKLEKTLSKENYNITGYLDAKDVSEKIDECDIFLLPFKDGLTLRRGSFFSIASHKKAIITTPGDETKDIFIHGEDLIYCKTVHEIKEQLKVLIYNKEVRVKLGENISKKLSQFSWNNIFLEMNKIYRKLNK